MTATTTHLPAIVQNGEPVKRATEPGISAPVAGTFTGMSGQCDRAFRGPRSSLQVPGGSIPPMPHPLIVMGQGDQRRELHAADIDGIRLWPWVLAAILAGAAIAYGSLQGDHHASLARAVASDVANWQGAVPNFHATGGAHSAGPLLPGTSNRHAVRRGSGQGRTSFVATVTGYDNDFACTGKRPGHPAYGITASGKRARLGYCAAGPNVPFGTRLSVPGYGVLTVEDRGGAIGDNCIDIFCDTHKAAMRVGRTTLTVKVIE